MLIAYLALGLVLGAGSSVVPGPCGLAIIGSASRVGRRRAVATAIGSGLGDFFYASAGVIGVGHLLAAHGGVITVLVAVSGAVLVAYGVMSLLRRPSARTTASRPLGGVAIGFVTLVCNPGALVTWSAVGAQLADATLAVQACAVLGIGSGSTMWFVGMAHVSARGRAVLGARMERVVQVASVLIVFYGLISVARALL